MNQSYAQYQVQSLKMTNIQRVMESVMVMFIALFSTAVLPSLLIQYVYNDPTMLQPPKVIEYIPMVCYAISALYVIFVIVTNMQRGKKIKQLEQDMYFSSGAGDTIMMADAMSDSDDEELKELEKMVDEAMAKAPSRPAKKSTSKARRK